MNRNANGGQLPGRREGRKLARLFRQVLDDLEPASDGPDRGIRKSAELVAEALDPVKHGTASPRTRPVGATHPPRRRDADPVAFDLD